MKKTYHLIANKVVKHLSYKITASIITVNNNFFKEFQHISQTVNYFICNLKKTILFVITRLYN